MKAYNRKYLSLHDRVCQQLKWNLTFEGLEPLLNVKYGLERQGSKYERGEIDVLTFNENTLELYEIKSYDRISLRKKAKKQLSRSKRFMRSVYGDSIEIRTFYVYPEKYNLRIVEI